MLHLFFFRVSALTFTLLEFFVYYEFVYLLFLTAHVFPCPPAGSGELQEAERHQ